MVAECFFLSGINTNFIFTFHFIHTAELSGFFTRQLYHDSDDNFKQKHTNTQLASACTWEITIQGISRFAALMLLLSARILHIL